MWDENAEKDEKTILRHNRMVKVIDDSDVLNHFYGDRRTFVVDFDEKLVDVDLKEMATGTIVFRIKKEK